MLPAEKFPAEVARTIAGVFMDIDDTLTSEGKLTATAYTALWRLKAEGLRVVPVTGRPAGWCDLIARQWPVDGVVGENGALAFYEVDGRLQRIEHPEVAGTDAQERLAKVRDRILAEVPGTRVAKDQPYRLYDLAVDFCEEPPDLGLETAEVIHGIFTRMGACAKISSIHVNGWFGDYDKLSMVKILAERLWQVDIADARDTYVFCGDSPNDAPMFEFFPHACAVANIKPFVEQNKISHTPRYITKAPGGEGFAEWVDILLRRRAG